MPPAMATTGMTASVWTLEMLTMGTTTKAAEKRTTEKDDRPACATRPPAPPFSLLSTF